MRLQLQHVLRISPYAMTAITVIASLLGDSSVLPQREAGGCGGGGGATAGIAIDKGVLRVFMIDDPNGEQTRKRLDAAKVALNPKVQQKSKLRKISLQRLEQAIAQQIANDRKPTDEMRYLAGLTRVQHVFFYPESGDIVLAGPAEGWFTDPAGHVLGMNTGRAILELQDLVTALRAYAPGNSGGPRMIGCSIDATQEGLAAMNQFLATLPKTADASMATDEYAQYIVNGLRTNLGLQKVSIMGVPPTTHFAQVMVEADYRMKLIGLGMEVPPVKMANYVDLASSSGVAGNAMQRWWFVPDYKCLKVAEDELAMELVGNGVKLLGEDEMVAADGTRHRAATKGTGNQASQLFVQGFTKKYPDLAARSYVFGQLRNLIDLTVAAVFIQKNDYYGRSDWKMPILGDETKLAVQVYEAPVQVETAVTHRWKKNGGLTTPVGGGVSLYPEQALTAENLVKDDGKADKARQEISLKGLAAGQWWWD